MIERAVLLSDLQSILRKLEEDLRTRADSEEVPEVRDWLKAEYQQAKDARRTAQTYSDWVEDFITQVAAAWVLGCVFARFLEDNELVDPPRIAGPGTRLDRARDEHTLFFQNPERAKLTDREYLLDIFAALEKQSATKELFGPHNPMKALPNWLGPDAASELLKFFQKIDPETGELVHNFTDPNWDTRFLGDLYQDLSEAAQKKYALLQTPHFVEEFILDRTLEPALDEFGLAARPGLDRYDKPLTEPGFRMIDPACGSGHFLLGSFPRILDRWRKQEPGTNVRELAQRTLNCIHGVDVNPYAVAIARFRLLLAAMQACDVRKLSDSLGFTINLACGDSLLHAPLRGQQQPFDFELTSEDAECDHAYQSEDLQALKKMLRSGIYHAVVANPPYITPKDRQLNARYRKRFESCHMKYSLAVPFMERIFRMAVRGGFTGQITANSFMKREFGKKLIEQFLPKIDLTHVVDTSGAYIPGHGTPTVILFGRHRRPVATAVRAVMGIRGEPSTPENPACGLVWSAIITQIDNAGSESEFISVGDSVRERFHSHPWSIGGGGAAELKSQLDAGATQLGAFIESVGFLAITGEDDVFVVPPQHAKRQYISDWTRPFCTGDVIRDWQVSCVDVAIYPYDGDDPSLTAYEPVSVLILQKYLWVHRPLLAARSMFGKTIEQHGFHYLEYIQFIRERAAASMLIPFAFVATHNHFVLDRGGKVFKQSAPVIKLPPEATEDDHLGLLGLLNSSTGCFWMQQVCHNKGRPGADAAAADEPWEFRFEYDGTKLQQFPVCQPASVELAKQLDLLAHRLSEVHPARVIRASFKTEASENLRQVLATAEQGWRRLRSEMITLQEELDWNCYRCYGLIPNTDVSPIASSAPPIELGMRAFEIVLARKVEEGTTGTVWFDRLHARPQTTVPEHWPSQYSGVVEERIRLIESDPTIALLEQFQFKRRWQTEPWHYQAQRALLDSLLDRLESYFDFDGRMNDDAKPTARLDIGLTSVAKLADVARQDPEFLEVGEVYRDDPAFDVQRLVEDLVAGEHVPLLPILRYKPAGLRKRKEWEQTWDLQRQEDAIDARTKLSPDDPQYLTEDQARDLKQREVGTIPVPPKYTSSDFISSGGARYWALRGKLDVPKERWISFPYCEGEDDTLMICWAGYDHLQQARAISEHFVDVQERLGGRDDPRLVPLLCCLLELLPWLKQWHNDVDPEFGMPMGDYFEGFLTEEARNLNRTLDELRDWEPPKRAGRRRSPRAKS